MPLSPQRIGRKKEAASRHIEKRSAKFGYFARRLTRQRSQPEWAETLAQLKSMSARGSVARPNCRAIERGPTEGREPPNPSCREGNSTRYERRPLPGARFFARSDGPPQGWASSRRCLRGYPRGASPVMKIGARDDRYEVNLPVVPAGTPSACAEARNSDQAGAASAAFHSNSVPSRQMA